MSLPSRRACSPLRDLSRASGSGDAAPRGATTRAPGGEPRWPDVGAAGARGRRSAANDRQMFLISTGIVEIVYAAPRQASIQSRSRPTEHARVGAPAPTDQRTPAPPPRPLVLLASVDRGTRKASA